MARPLGVLENDQQSSHLCQRPGLILAISLAALMFTFTYRDNFEGMTFAHGVQEYIESTKMHVMQEVRSSRNTDESGEIFVEKSQVGSEKVKSKPANYTNSKAPMILDNETDSDEEFGVETKSNSTIDTTDTNNIMNIVPDEQPTLKFFILEPPPFTSALLEGELQAKATAFYKSELNEASAEIWLHRGFLNMNNDEGRTMDYSEADIFVIAGYPHLFSGLNNRQAIATNIYTDLIINKTKPHLLLMPTTNPGLSTQVGITQLSKALQSAGVNLWSVGFERNPFWQAIAVQRILPIPYVVSVGAHTKQSADEDANNSTVEVASKRVDNFVFYAGNQRDHAREWGGCFRQKMTASLFNETDMYVRVSNKHLLTQEKYNEYMQSSDYCLILCGDTPTSRSLASAMVALCIPIRVGSRLRGLCDLPCFKGWGWAIPGEKYPHLAFTNRIPWNEFPEVDEMEFTKNGISVLNNDIFGKYDQARKDKLRRIMQDHREGFIYGWGNPVNSIDFGKVCRYILESFQSVLSAQD